MTDKTDQRHAQQERAQTDQKQCAGRFHISSFRAMIANRPAILADLA
jgi:hypothetical protein